MGHVTYPHLIQGWFDIRRHALTMIVLLPNLMNKTRSTLHCRQWRIEPWQPLTCTVHDIS